MSIWKQTRSISFPYIEFPHQKGTVGLCISEHGTAVNTAAMRYTHTHTYIYIIKKHTPQFQKEGEQGRERQRKRWKKMRTTSPGKCVEIEEVRKETDTGSIRYMICICLPCTVHWSVSILFRDRCVCTTLEKILYRLRHALENTVHERSLTTRTSGNVREGSIKNVRGGGGTRRMLAHEGSIHAQALDVRAATACV